MEEGEGAPISDPLEIARWAYFTTLEFLDGPRRNREGVSEGRGIHFSRALPASSSPGTVVDARRLVALAPSRAYQEAKVEDSLSKERFKVPELSERELRAEERKEESERRKEEKLQRAQKRKDDIRQKEQELATASATRGPLSEEEADRREREEWQSFLERRVRQKSGDLGKGKGKGEGDGDGGGGLEALKLSILLQEYAENKKRVRLKRPLDLSVEEGDRMEAEDLSDAMFYYGRNCGLNSDQFAQIQEEMIDAFNTVDLNAGSLPLMVRDIGFPYNRLRVNLDQGAASEEGDRMFEYENEVRVHTGLKQASLLFMPVYYDEEIVGSRELEEPVGGSLAPTPGTRLDVKKLITYIMREGSGGDDDDDAGDTRMVPLMTLQTCMLLKAQLQSVAESDIINQGSTIDSLIQLIAGGAALRKKYQTRDTEERVSLMREAAARLVFIPIFTGKELTIPDLSDPMTLTTFAKRYDSLARKSPSAAREIGKLRVARGDTGSVPELLPAHLVPGMPEGPSLGSIGGGGEDGPDTSRTGNPFLVLSKWARWLAQRGRNGGGDEDEGESLPSVADDVNVLDIATEELFRLATPGSEIEHILIQGFGYDGFMAQHGVLGTIVMADLFSLRHSVALDVHLRHINFGLNKSLLREGGRLNERVLRVSSNTGYNPYVGGMETHRLFLFSNADPTSALLSSSYALPRDSLGALLESSTGSGNGTRIRNPLEHFTFMEGSGKRVSAPRGIESQKEKEKIILLMKRDAVRKDMYRSVQLVELTNAFVARSAGYIDYYPDVFQREENRGSNTDLKGKFRIPTIKASASEAGSKANDEPASRYIMSVRNGRSQSMVVPEGIETPVASVYRMVMRELLYNAYHTKIRIGNNPSENRVKYPPLIAINDGFPFSIQRQAGEDRIETEEEEEREMQNSAIYTPIHFGTFVRQVRPKILDRLIPSGKSTMHLDEFSRIIAAWTHRVGVELSSTYVDNFGGIFTRPEYDFVRFFTTMSPMSTQASLLNLWFSYAIALDNVGQEYKPLGVTARGVGAWGPMPSVVPLYSDSGMNDLEGMDFTESIESFPDEAAIERFYLKKYSRAGSPRSDVRRVHLGLIDELFTEYAKEYGRLFNTHWEMEEDVTDLQILQCELYTPGPLRMWHLNELSQLSRLTVAAITYFSFRRHVLFGNYFAMYSHANGMVSGLGEHFTRLTGDDVRTYYAKMRQAHQRNFFSLEDRTSGELDALKSINQMEGWVDTLAHKRRLYAMGAFQQDTLPPWKPTLDFFDARYWERVPKIKERGMTLWEREVKERVKGRKTIAQRETILMNEPDVNVGDEARLLFPSWWNQSFSRVKFSPSFTLENFDPSKWMNLNTFKMIEHMAATDVSMSPEQVETMKEWLCGRNTQGKEQDPPLRLRHSGDHLKGNGLFCDDPRGIPPGTFIMPFDGLITRHSDLYGAPEDRVPREFYDGSDTAYFGTDSVTGEPIYVSPGSIGETSPRATQSSTGVVKAHLGRFLNGAVSKKIANCAIVKWIVEGQTKLWIVNVYARTIQPGEELLWTYDNSGIDFFKQIGLYSQSAGFVYPPSHLHDYLGTTQMTVETDDPQRVVHDPAMKFLDRRKEPGKESEVRTAVLLQRAAEEETEEEDEEEEEEGRLEEVSPEELRAEQREAEREAREEEQSFLRAEGEEEEAAAATQAAKDRLEAYDLKHEEDITRFGLIHSLYSGVPVVTAPGIGTDQDEGVVDVPRLDFYRARVHVHHHDSSEDTDFEIRQPLPYVRSNNRNTWKIRAVLKPKRDRVRPDSSLNTRFEKIQWQRRNLLYYGVPVPRMVLPTAFVSPAFKRLSERYGETSVMNFLPKHDVDNYGNMPSALYREGARGKITDTALSMSVRRKAVIDNSSDLLKDVTDIRKAFFLPRRRAVYQSIEAFLSELEGAGIRRALAEIETAKDLSRQPGLSGELEEPQRYTLLTKGLDYSDAAHAAIVEEWTKRAGYSFYAKSHIVASHYANVYSNVVGDGYIRNVLGPGTVPASILGRDSLSYLENYDAESPDTIPRAVVRYSGSVGKGLGLYATRNILPGEPIMPFLGEVVTNQEFEDRVIGYAERYESIHLAYKEQVQLVLRREVSSMDTPPEGEELSRLEVAVRQRVGKIFSETYGIDHPDPLYYAADFIEIEGTSMKIDPSLKGNDARFANTSRFYNNCSLQFVLVRNTDSNTRMVEPYRLVPWLVNTYSRPIKHNQEILWDYAEHEIEGEMGLDYERVPWFVNTDTNAILRDEKPRLDIHAPDPEKVEVKIPSVGVSRFPLRNDQPVWRPTLEEGEDRRLQDSLFAPETTFPYGKETVNQEWSQYVFVLKPNSIDAHHGYSGALPATGMEIVRSMLAVTSNFVPEGMSPLDASGRGDVLNPMINDKTISLRVPMIVKETKALSDAITDAWCNISSILNQLPMRHFETTVIRNRWLDVQAGGEVRERVHTLAGDLKYYDSMGIVVEDTRRVLAMLLAHATLAIDDLQKRVFGTIPSIGGDEARGRAFSAFVQRDDVMPSQGQRNMLFLLLASWRTTSALFTNDKESPTVQTRRLQALLRALGFTSLQISRISERKRGYRVWSTEGPSSDLEKGDKMRGFYTHVFDKLLENETLVPDEAMRTRYRKPTVREISREGRITPPTPTELYLSLESDVLNKDVRERLSYPFIRKLQDYEWGLGMVETVQHTVTITGPSPAFTDEPEHEEHVINTGTNQRLQTLIQAVNENLVATRNYHGMERFYSVRLDPSEFPAAKSYVEAHYDVMILHNLSALNGLFHAIRESLIDDNPVWEGMENPPAPLRVTRHALEGIRILSEEIDSYPAFQEWKAIRGPYIYVDLEDERKEVLNRDVIDPTNTETFGRGPSAYFLLAIYARAMYLPEFDEYDKIFDYGNELMEGPFFFRTEETLAGGKRVSIGHPWWSIPREDEPEGQGPFEEEEPEEEEDPETTEEEEHEELGELEEEDDDGQTEEMTEEEIPEKEDSPPPQRRIAPTFLGPAPEEEEEVPEKEEETGPRRISPTFLGPPPEEGVPELPSAPPEEIPGLILEEGTEEEEEEEEESPGTEMETEREAIPRAQAFDEIFSEFDKIRRALKTSGKRKLTNAQRLAYLAFLMDSVSTASLDDFEEAMIAARGSMRSGPNRAAALRALMNSFNISTDVLYDDFNRTYFGRDEAKISAKVVDTYVGRVREYLEPFVRVMDNDQVAELLTRLTFFHKVLSEDGEDAISLRETILKFDHPFYGGRTRAEGPFRPQAWSKKVVDS
ncbi:MAG: SET domain-containing protein [Candidatus Thorarchaeota archaeon]|jgi:hypothetical protein